MSMPRKFTPLAEGSPTLVETCPGCRLPFQVGDVVTLVLIGPGADEDARGRAREGRAYNAMTLAAHWSCGTGEQP